MTNGDSKNAKKKSKLRNNEYYDTQEMFDELYRLSNEGYIFKNLMELITDERNIMLAYRNIKRNKGSQTKGTNNSTIHRISEDEPQKLVTYVQNRLKNFRPHSVRRVEIPKDNGKIRPLGIPTIEDRLIQQCIKQILEPICEAKFYNHSYGFRPNRSAHHAISRAVTLANINKLHYAVDIDIKGFFDNVDHGKLLKQIWTLGIQDKRLLSVISKLLKAEIKGEGTPNKGTPQGGIISPLLSNIVLNELDWWVADQWDTFKTRYEYKSHRQLKDGTIIADNSCRLGILRRDTNLKEMFIVRYADDFKIFCRDYKTAFKVYNAVTQWLKERLSLEISAEKSRVTNLRKNYTEFLGFKLKVVPKGDKWVVNSFISDKSKRKIIKQFKDGIRRIQVEQSVDQIKKYNASVLGRQQYYQIATHVSKDFNKVDFLVRRFLKSRIKDARSKSGYITKTYEKFYGHTNGKKIFVKGQILFPIAVIKTKPPRNFSQITCNYTEQGRLLIHDKLRNINMKMLRYLMNNPVKDQSVEYNDNRISLYCGQHGMCKVTRKPLNIGNVETHHIIPKAKGGSDHYNNLMLIRTEVHKLIHATKAETIKIYLDQLQLTETELQKVSELRIKVGNCAL